MNYCRIFTELAETFLETIVNGSMNGKQHYAIKALDFALVCVGHHDYEVRRSNSILFDTPSNTFSNKRQPSILQVAQITFNLWYRLSEILYQRNNDELTCVFKPYIERLIGALCRHCQIEQDHVRLALKRNFIRHSTYTNQAFALIQQLGLIEEGDGFADFRMRVFELIKDVVFVVGSSHCFRQMFATLTGPGLQGQPVTWDMIEAALFVMQAVAKNILP